MADQDEGIEDIGESLDILNARGQNIAGELDEQNKLIGNMNTDVAATQNTMDKVNSNLLNLLATQDGCQLGVVIGMAIACVISVALLVSAFF